MKKRLRKKKHLGEFKQYGFELTIKLKPGHSVEEINDFYIPLLDKIEEKSLSVGGGGNGLEIGFFTTRRGPRRGKWFSTQSATENDRVTMREIAESFPEFVESVEVGPLVDAWHSE